MKKRLFPNIFLVILIASGTLLAHEPYKRPPQEVIDVLDAPPFPRAVTSPAGDFLLLADYETMPSISYLAQPLLRLAGIRITPGNNSRQQLTFFTGLTLVAVKDGSTRKISLPEGIKMGYPEWSYDGKWVAFARYLDNGVELWIVDIATAQAKQLTQARVNAALGSGFTWLPDNRALLVNIVPEGRRKPPDKPLVPAGPNIQQTSGKFSKVWTYQDLLENPHDEALFEYYATSQVVEIDVGTGKGREVGLPGIYLENSPSPDGNYILVSRVKKPFSYSVPFYNFARSLEVWDREGRLIRLVADLPVADEIPINGVEKGPRRAHWQPLRPATLVWVEALDEGNPEINVPFRDGLMSLEAPFKGDPREIGKTPERYAATTWLGREGLALVSDFSWKKQWRTTFLMDFSHPETQARKVFDLSVRDQYNDPGRPVMVVTPAGERVALQDKDSIYLAGSGASPEGDRPFLDRMNLKTLAKTRLFQCQPGRYEAFVDFALNSGDRIIISSESSAEPPNYYVLSLKSRKRQALTDFKDPAPQLTGMKKQLIKYKRADGVDLSGTLYLPPGHKEGERLPVVVWAYPLEYTDARVAGQVRGSPHRFTFFRGTSQLFFVTQGYAVLDNAQMPVVGDPKTVNDTFVDQIVANAKAAIDTLEAMGVGDSRRVGVGGHSYGAFMTANLLAHCDLFAAGIARSGAYNRTLTPFGFQSERRTLWEAPEVYFKVSPFMYAHKINEPILLIHGEADNNSGTFPIQSERLFHALKGHGATARLVLLPHESHGYSARESVLHVLAEMFEWFDTYVKGRK
ncbi:MAG: prolyl oligopeptidase family serine peptidase [Clostridiales bacterium]|nr:prolyl oligopeptidase family serine peptidase [Clostridiales bacterium]